MSENIQPQRQRTRHEEPADEWVEEAQRSARRECAALKAGAGALDTLLDRIGDDLTENDAFMVDMDNLPPVE